MAKKKILITGASGFIGRNLVERLRKENVKLFALVNSQKKTLPIVGKSIDLRNLTALRAYVAQIKPNLVFHLGALVDLSRDFKTARKCIEINILGTLNLLESLKNSNLEHLIFLSTEEVYGDGPVPYKETQLLRPPSPYAISKMAGEELCRFYSRQNSLLTTILRISTVYGPLQPVRRFIPSIILRALKNEEILLPSGKKKRDYVFVDDVIDALILSLKRRGETAEIINIGGHKSVQLKDLVSLILKITKSKAKVVYNSYPEREFEADEWLSDNKKARRLLSWIPKTSLKEGIKKTMIYYKNLV